MSFRNQIEAAIRRAGGDFSEASHAVCKILDEETPQGETSGNVDEDLIEYSGVED